MCLIPLLYLSISVQSCFFFFGGGGNWNTIIAKAYSSTLWMKNGCRSTWRPAWENQGDFSVSSFYFVILWFIFYCSIITLYAVCHFYYRAIFWIRYEFIKTITHIKHVCKQRNIYSIAFSVCLLRPRHTRTHTLPLASYRLMRVGPGRG